VLRSSSYPGTITRSPEVGEALEPSGGRAARAAKGDHPRKPMTVSPNPPSPSVSTDGPAPLAGLGHRLLQVVSIVCLLHIPIGLGWVPFMQHAWGYTLWLYLPNPVAWGLAAGVLLLVVPASRSWALGWIERVPLSPRLGWALLLAMPLAIWPLRSRLAYGDSRILYYTMQADPSVFIFPDIGATFLLQAGFWAGHTSGVGGLEWAQASIVLCGPLFLYLLMRAARLLAPTTGTALFIVLLVVGCGSLRIFTGHLEVYSFVLVTTAAYAWSCLAFLRGECSWLAPALAFGFGLWVHVQFLFLGPSIMLLFVLAEPGRPLAHYLRRWVPAGLVCLAPTLVFFLALVVLGQHEALEAAFAKANRWSELGPDAREEVWIRWWGGSGPGTLYMIFDRGHLKYLSNAFFLLAPWTGLVLLAFVLARRRAFVASTEARFLLSACIPMALYAMLLRPVWGPYDWDLFSSTAMFTGLLAGHLLVRELPDPPLRELALMLVGSAILFVLIPFLIVGVAPAHKAGPFAHDFGRRVEGETLSESFTRQIEPWL